MIKRQELEALTKAWPDENGVLSDPRAYNEWVKKERKNFVRLVTQTTGADQLNTLSEKQRGL